MSESTCFKTFADICQGEKMAEVRLVAGFLAEAKSLSSQQISRTTLV